jgi:MoaA/NifB/PqqE/SkfB family radical SAM enzyme
MTEIPKEITIELTNYCPRDCKYCSSNTTKDKKSAKFIDYNNLYHDLISKHFTRIILSGGEPLSHPRFFDILQLAKKHADDVVLYTNELTHVVYNANIIDGIYIEANLTITDSTKSVHVLKRIEQGREATRPEVHFSGNYDGKCSICDSPVMLPTGEMVKSPCDKKTPFTG